MTRDDVVTLLALNLGNRTDLNDAIILQMMLQQETQLEGSGRFQPWFLITERAFNTMTIGESRLALPDDFLMEVEEQGLWIFDAAGGTHELLKGSEQDLLREYKDTDPGQPQAYSMAGHHITVYPAPDWEYPAFFRYAAQDQKLSTNIENNWLKYASDLMIAVVGKEIAGKTLQNDKLAATYERDILPAWERLYRLHESRAHTNRDYTMGEA